MDLFAAIHLLFEGGWVEGERLGFQDKPQFALELLQGVEMGLVLMKTTHVPLQGTVGIENALALEVVLKSKFEIVVVSVCLGLLILDASPPLSQPCLLAGDPPDELTRYFSPLVLLEELRYQAHPMSFAAMSGLASVFPS